jgi:Fe-S oxidoreductase
MSLLPIPMEGEETFGVSKIQDFTWKQLLDLCACTWCGRCQANCPAHNSGKTLSPREVILNLKEHLLETSPALLNVKAATAKDGHSKELIGGVVTEEETWYCRKIKCRKVPS